MSTTHPKINTAILAIMRETKAVGKDNKNTAQGYNFRGIDDIMNEVHPLFAKHGVFITTKVLEQIREERPTRSGGNMIYSILKVQFNFHAEDGSKVECEIIGEGADTGDKASNKALSVALKYAILQMLMIPTKDFIDPEVDSPELLPKAKPLPGMKGSKSFDDWRAVTWHLPFGAKSDKSFEYTGHTLAEIELNDPRGLLYWTHTPFSKSKNPEDQILRLALDKAAVDLAKAPEKEELKPVASEDLPQHDPAEEPNAKDALLKELQELCSENHVPPKLIFDYGKQKNKIPKSAKTLAEAPEEVLRAAIDKFQFFVNMAQEQEAK